MSEMTCEELRELSAELALGVAGGLDQGAATDHLQHCAQCRAELRELAEVADGLAALAPAVDPPRGFEERVVTSVLRAPRRLTRPRVWLAAAAAALALIAGTAGWLIGQPASHHGYASRLLGGELYSSGRPAGAVLVSTGVYSWMSVAVQANPADDWATCQMETASGRILTVGTFTLTGGRGYWAAAVPPGTGPTLRIVRLVSPGGQVIAQANLASRS